MQTTFIVRNLTPEALSELTAATPLDAYNQLHKWAFGDLPHCVSVKYGHGSFGCRVSWNTIMRDVSAGSRPMTMKVGPRRGYKLFTFDA